MPDADDFPRCSTCEHWHEESQDKGVCAELGISGWQKGNDLYRDPNHKLDVLRTTADFGCVLHSSLQSDNES